MVVAWARSGVHWSAASGGFPLYSGHQNHCCIIRICTLDHSTLHALTNTLHKTHQTPLNSLNHCCWPLFIKIPHSVAIHLTVATLLQHILCSTKQISPHHTIFNIIISHANAKKQTKQPTLGIYSLTKPTVWQIYLQVQPMCQISWITPVLFEQKYW